ncbi:MAG: 4Fe-4S dicluster domain-containing protein [Thermodesulfobacteriota bacterium]
MVPFHRAILKKPVYATIRYAFHACLLIVPVWYSGHIYLWEESRFAWYWTPLPDIWADWMTLAILSACVFFLVRRILFKRHLKIGIFDFILVLITGTPFLSGYLLTHGTLDGIAFFDNYLWYLHVISGEAMLVMIVFLFCRTHLSKKRCAGCAACVENCPTETLEYEDRNAFRLFKYSHYQCICCGSCVNVCPDQAAGLRHELRLRNLIQITSKVEIRKVELKTCAHCGIHFAPKPQVEKLSWSLNQDEIEIITLDLCPRCKKIRIADVGRAVADMA